MVDAFFFFVIFQKPCSAKSSLVCYISTKVYVIIAIKGIPCGIGVNVLQKSVLIGIGIYVFGFVLACLSSAIFYSGNAENSYYYGIIFSVLYLSAIVGISTSLIIIELRKNQKDWSK